MEPVKSMASRFARLSPSRQALVRLCQRVNFGTIQHVRVRGGDPVLDHDTILFLDEKLDVMDPTRREQELADFGLSDEVNRLMLRLDRIGDGKIDRIEVRAGIPRRIVVEAAFSAFEMDTKTFLG